MTTLSRTLPRLLVGAGMTLAAVVSTSVAADATSYCGRYDGHYCTTVTAISSGSYLDQHKGPSYSSGSNGNPHLHNGDHLNLECWTTGDGDADGHGDHYWFLAAAYRLSTDQRGYLGYVNDWYVKTGSPTTWKKQISHC